MGYARKGMAVAGFARKVVRIADDVVDRLRVASWFIIVSSVAALCWYAADREPPFALLHIPAATAQAGGKLRLVVDVRRDVSRECDADFSRYIFGSDGARRDLITSHASAAMIAGMELRYPGKLPIVVSVPDDLEPGPARFVTVLAYRCNKVHALWPIIVTMDIPFTVVE